LLQVLRVAQPLRWREVLRRETERANRRTSARTSTLRIALKRTRDDSRASLEAP